MSVLTQYQLVWSVFCTFLLLSWSVCNQESECATINPDVIENLFSVSEDLARINVHWKSLILPKIPISPEIPVISKTWFQQYFWKSQFQWAFQFTGIPNFTENRDWVRKAELTGYYTTANSTITEMFFPQYSANIKLTVYDLWPS